MTKWNSVEISQNFGVSLEIFTNYDFLVLNVASVAVEKVDLKWCCSRKNCLEGMLQ